MASRLQLLLLTSLIGPSLAQICNCPLVGNITTTTTPVCPTGDLATITTISTVGACRNFRTTTTTITRTAGACVCPTQTTVTSTATPDCPNVTGTSTVVEPTIDCPWAATVTQTITQYGLSNTTAYPTTGSGISGGTAAPTGILPTGTSPSRPTCSLTQLPSSFYIRDALSGYLLYDPTCRKAVGCPKKEDATPFHLNDTDPDFLGGIPQLSLYYPPLPSPDAEEYGAYVQYNGGPIYLFRAGEVPDGLGGENWYVVTAGWSEYLCRMSLITWNLHDLAEAQSCDGYLALGYGFGGDECPETRLRVEAA